MYYIVHPLHHENVHLCTRMYFITISCHCLIRRSYLWGILWLFTKCCCSLTIIKANHTKGINLENGILENRFLRACTFYSYWHEAHADGLYLYAKLSGGSYSKCPAHRQPHCIAKMRGQQIWHSTSRQCEAIRALWGFLKLHGLMIAIFENNAVT